MKLTMAITAAMVMLYYVLAKLLLLALPQPHGPFQYLVAGAFAAAISLGIVLAITTVHHGARRKGHP
jgi:hypothetical protein